jgi:hypothetical protein
MPPALTRTKGTAMAQANRKNTTKPTAFLNAVARIHLSHLFQDPFVAAAFKAAEDDGLPSGERCGRDLHRH